MSLWVSLIGTPQYRMCSLELLNHLVTLLTSYQPPVSHHDTSTSAGSENKGDDDQQSPGANITEAQLKTLAGVCYMYIYIWFIGLVGKCS